MTRSVEEQMADIERRMKQLRARKQRIVARENAKARKRRTHLIIRLGGILSNSHSNGSSSLGTESVSSLHRGGAPFYRIFCTLLDSPQALRQ